MAEAGVLDNTAPTVVVLASKAKGDAVSDLLDGLKSYNLWWSLSAHEIKQRFRRTVIGPFWLTLSMGIFVAALGFVMSQLFGQDVSWYVPYLAIGIIFWTFLSTVINEAGSTFVVAQGYIRNVPMPLSVHFYRMISRNIIAWLHNMAIYVFVYFIFLRIIDSNFLFFFPGLLLFVLVVSSAALIFSVISTRYRDLEPVIASVLQVVFFTTPIFWSVDLFPERPAFINWNPVFHLLEVVRAPLLGNAPSPLSWLVTVGLLLVLVPIALYLYRRAFARIPYWV